MVRKEEDRCSTAVPGCGGQEEVGQKVQQRIPEDFLEEVTVALSLKGSACQVRMEGHEGKFTMEGLQSKKSMMCWRDRQNTGVGAEA